jgi:hypothetical protein
MSKITSAIAAAFLASASFASVALADEGDYYRGVERNEQTNATQSVHSSRYGYTGSVSRAAQSDNAQTESTLNSGDYYDGAFRPN